MKNIIRLSLILLLLALIIWPVYYFVSKNNNGKPSFEIAKPLKRNIKNFVICSGVILPKEEVEIKSRVSGVLENLFVENGDSVSKNTIIAKITIIPDERDLANSKSQVDLAQINFSNQQSIYTRNKKLFEKGVISRSNFEIIETDYLNSKEQLNSSKRNYRIIQSGGYSNRSKSNTSIVSTIDGIVTHLPAKIGSSIIQSNNFSEGTTIAKIANTKEMMFEGNVKEYEVSTLSVGMPVIIKTSLSEVEIEGVLTEISTSGKKIDGMILFEIKCKLIEANLRNTGFSANAKIVVEEKSNVLSLKEEWINFNKDSTFVFIHNNEENTHEKRYVKLGLSDGIYTQVISGINDNEMIRVYDN